MKLFRNVLARLDGWKTAISYLLLSVPGLGDYPMLASAIKKVIEEPSAQTVIDLILQGALAGAVGHRVVKNIKQ